jgi:hypothetical protein
MDPQEHKEADPETLPGDARALVAALTNLLLDDHPPPPRTAEETQIDPQRHTNATITPDVILRNFTSTSSSNDGDEGQTPLPPTFLADSQVRAALQRADSLRPQGHLSDEPYFPSSVMGVTPLFQDGREQGGILSRDFHPTMGPYAYPDSSYAPRSPVTLPSQDSNPEHVGVSAKFEQGKETASVLQITRRPRLRPKDISHRQSLGGNGQGPLLSTAGYDSPPPTTPPFGISAYPSATPAPRNFMVTLAFGQRRVSLPGSYGMSVSG